mgnify:CR=1 FL=1
MCLYAAVAMVIVGVLTLLPGLITNNMMERAFSWKRLLCALMIPLTIGAATGGFAWGAGAFGADGLAVNDSYQSANGHPDWKGVKSDEAKKSDDLGGVVRQLGEDIANRVGKAAGDAIDKALSTGKKAWQWLSGGDGKGNVFQKAGQAAGDAASGAWDWLSGGTEGQRVPEGRGRRVRGLGLGFGRRRERQRVREDGPGGGRPVVVPVRLSRPARYRHRASYGPGGGGERRVNHDHYSSNRRHRVRYRAGVDRQRPVRVLRRPRTGRSSRS